jgi:peptidyl-prolyl cis-trans isomerase C
MSVSENISVNGIGVNVEAQPSPELAAVRELLRQRAIAVGLLDKHSQGSDQVDAAVEALLEREVATPTPTEEECRRYYDQHPQEFESGDLVHVRHILFQVTPRVNVPAVRARAEQTLNELLQEPDRFDAVAREMSNCPSGQHGGNLGQIGRGETVPEFEKALFKLGPTGLLSDLIKTRYGFHIVAVDRRIPGTKVPFDVARPKIAERLQTAVQEKAIQQYVQVLAGQAEIVGVDLGGSTSPLLQ